MSSYKKPKRSTKKKSKTSLKRFLPKVLQYYPNTFKTYRSSKKKINTLKKTKWDILVHASNPFAMEKIAEYGALKVPEDNINAWLNSNTVKKAFGDYFNQDDYKHKIIDLLVKNSNDLSKLKYKKVKDLQQIPDINEDNINWIYTPGVYTHYIYDNLKFESIYECWTFGCTPDLLFGISSKILKDKPWISCPFMGNGNCIFGDKNDLFLSSKGKLKKMPLSKLANIKYRINSTSGDGYFINTHEIIFDEIPLKYVNVIYVTPKFFDDAKKYFPNIPIQILPEDRSDYEALLKPFSK